MDDNVDFVCVYMFLMLMAFAQLACIQHTLHEKDETVVRRQWKYRPPILYEAFERFTFVGMSDVVCCQLTRFTYEEITRFLLLLRLDEIRFRNRIMATPEEALGVLLIRLSYPTRYWRMMNQFGHSRTWFSIFFNDTLIHLYRRYSKMLAWDDRRLTFAKLSSYAMAIHSLGGGLIFWGFINCTLNATCRPVLD